MFRKRVRRAAALAAVSLLCGHAPLHARHEPPRQGETVAVLLAALPALRPLLPEGTAALDATLLCRARLVGWSCPGEVRERAQALGFILSGRGFTRVCLGGPRSCRLVGARSLTTLSPPEIQDRTARVQAELLWSEAPRGPLTERHFQVRLRREPAGWAVSEVEELP